MKEPLPCSGTKVTFSDLSLGLKIAVILAWIAGAFGILTFLVAFIQGMTMTV